MERSAQTVELLLEHQSMSSSECRERIALALKNEGIVNVSLPGASPSLMPGLGTPTEGTICGGDKVPVASRRRRVGFSVQHWTSVLSSTKRALACLMTNG